MGQQNISQNPCQNLIKSNKKTHDDLIFYMNVNDNQFGTIPVYTSTKRPSSYVAKVQKVIENSKIYNIFELVQNSQLSSLSSLHAFQVNREKYFTGKIKQQITAYWEYYNYSFDDFLKMRFLKRIPFSQKQIWLIIKACCESFSLLNFHHLTLDLDLKHIMVVPEGKIKIYWHQVQLDNNHLKYYQRIKKIMSRRKSLQSDIENRQFKLHDERDQDYFFFSPEQIQGIQKKQNFELQRQETMKIDFSRANSFRLGMILLYCITLTNPIKTCYGVNNATGERKIKLMVLNALYESKIQNSSKYSDDLKHLIKLLLLEDPNKRIPIDYLQNVYQKYISLDTELSMGMNDHPLYAPSSSRKNLHQQNSKEHAALQKNNRLQPTNQQRNIKHSKMSSEKIIQQSQVKSCDRQYDGDIHQDMISRYSNNSNEPQIFDKFDTKTIKISSTYNRR